MDLKQILAISGQPGLFKFIAQSTRGVIVEALSDGKRMNVPPTARVSSMGEIAIFTDTEEVPIETVYRNIYEDTDGKETVSHKASEKEIRDYFEKILPDYDRDRVHLSDMKKVLQLYNVLQAQGLIDLEESEGEDRSEPVPEAAAE